MLISNIFNILQQPIHLITMEKVKKCRITLKPERNEELWIEYGKVIASYGSTARFMAKAELYRQAGEKFHITGGTARNLIQKMIRDRGRSDL